MNVFRQLILGMTFVFAALLCAQSPPASDNSAAPTPAPSPTAPIEPPSLIPPNILPGPGIGALPQMPAAADLQMLNALFKQTSLGKAADDYRLHVQVVRLESQIRNDAELQAMRASAEQTSTDLEKRKRLKAYYHQYYSRLRTMADTPDLKAYLDGQEAAHAGLLAQPRVRPNTNPVAASATATPLPTPVQARAGAVQRHP